MNSRFRLLVLSFCLMSVGLFAAPARADVVYTFSGANNAPGGDSAAVGFQYIAPNFISSFTSLYQSQLNSCKNCLVSSFPVVYFLPSNVFGDSVVFDDVNNLGSVFMFSFGAFTAPGTYYSSSPFNSGTLTVSTAAVPEPRSLLFVLISGGFMGLLFCIRQRKSALLQRM